MGNKKIVLSVSEALLSEIDEISSSENVSRSQWITSVLKSRILSVRKRKNEEALKQGYKDMGKINSRLAEESIVADNEQLLAYEQKLSESE